MTEPTTSPPPRPRSVLDTLLPWRARQRYRTTRRLVEQAFDEGAPRSLDQDLRDVVPADLIAALPDVDPAVLFTAWSLARHGHTAADLARMFTLTDDQTRAIISRLRH
ncbi:MAG TPA: hypothetical protein VG247_17025 [Pseudonocardiaceae bacterium]|jgi:hypothetical protein|nr:hypothetical protein [Pseudonocardiaceae bacterium]